MDRDRENSICAEREGSYRQKRGIKKKEAISVKESRPRRAILGNSNPDFGSETFQRGQGTRAAPCSKWCCALPLFTPPFFFAPAPPLSSSLRLSSALVRKPSHSQKTQNADGHVSRRQQSSPRKGPRKEGGGRECVRVCVCACCGARRFTAYILAALRRAMQRVDAEVSLFRHRERRPSIIK